MADIQRVMHNLPITKQLLLTMENTEHPFAPFIRTLGKGKKGSRSLTREEACEAFGMILDQQATPEQLGAFLMLLRVKEETSEEIAGFVEATRNRLGQITLNADLDWSTYAGKRRHLPWFFLSALLLSKNGVRVAMHGAKGHTPGRIYIENILNLFNISPADDLSDAQSQLEENNFCFLSLSEINPVLADIINLRPILGLRSPVHTLCRLINPLNAPYRIDGVFHPAYGPIHAGTAQLLEQNNSVTIKGDSGEAEIKPDMDCTLQWVENGEYSEKNWPRHFPKRIVKEESLDPNDLLHLWQGKIDSEYGKQAVIETTAVCLKLLGKTTDSPEAIELARSLWASRNCDAFRR